MCDKTHEIRCKEGHIDIWVISLGRIVYAMLYRMEDWEDRNVEMKIDEIFYPKLRKLIKSGENSDFVNI